jgi:mono/diheme cytochrome c family protein
MKMSYFFLALALAVIGGVSIAGFRGQHSPRPPIEIFPDMNYQDKVKDQVPSAFFADGNSARAPIPGTVAEEMPAQNDYWATGKWDDTHWGDGIPVHDAVDGGRPLRIDAADMARGRERYTISCEVCHGAAGDGQGITSKYGLNGAANYHSDKYRQMTDGEIFNTITNGHGQMLGYNYNIVTDDRWRIIMYIRALQRSQNALVADASSDEQAQLEKTKKPVAPAPAPVPSEGAPAAPQPAAAAPATTPAPANEPATTNAPTAKPPGEASNDRLFHDPFAYALSERLINDHGYSIVGPTYYEAFASPAKPAPAKPPGSALNKPHEFDTTYDQFRHCDLRIKNPAGAPAPAATPAPTKPPGSASNGPAPVKTKYPWKATIKTSAFWISGTAVPMISSQP